MEKLIELLNEYDGDVLEYGFVDGDIRRKVKNFDNERNTWKSVVWYTKQFGFIKWLVENEKIDGEKFQEPKIRGIIGLISNWHNSEGKSYKDYSKELAYESLLMLLSIQDEPIEFLVSILK